MNRRFCAAFFLVFLCFSGFSGLPFTAAPARAHGTGYRTPQNKPVALEFYYSTGDVMAYQEAKVYSPRDEKFAFQSGRTDEYGRFAFTPDTAGAWRVAVRDLEGHLAEAVLDVPEDFFDDFNGSGNAARAQPETPEGLELYLRAALGVSVLFNIAAFTLLYRRQVKKTKKVL